MIRRFGFVFFLLFLTGCYLFAPPDVLYRVNERNCGTTSDIDLQYCTRASLVRVIDGDTIDVLIESPVGGLASSERVRLLGIDAPEISSNEPYAAEAKLYLGTLISSTTPLYLAFDWDLRDSYGRLLAYVVTDFGLCTNSSLVLSGYASVFRTYSFHFMDEFIEYEDFAEQENLGIWE